MRFTDLVPWKTRELNRSPTDEPVASLRREFNRLFDEFLTEPLGANSFGDFSPTMDVSETESAIEIKAEVPGLDEQDIEILLDDKTLTLRGEKKDEKERTEDGVRIRENAYGRFERAIPLPAEVEPDATRATYEKGVLSIVLQKTERAKQARRKIPIGQ